MARSKRPTASSPHPASLFSAPAAITRGTPLKHLLGVEAVDLIAESIVRVHPGFARARFRKAALTGLDALELKPRAAWIASALKPHLPSDFEAAADVLIASLGPELTATEGNGLAVFFYLPHSAFIEMEGPSSLAAGLKACYELTKRFSAEFCVRPLLEAFPDESLSVLTTWTDDRNPHVRRLVSEGSRPRLPWGSRLRRFQQDPRHTLPLLERLKNDPELYVRRSVANHLADLLKDHPGLIENVCRPWLEEIAAPRAGTINVIHRCALIRHAVRLPARKGEPAAVTLRKAADPRLWQ